MEPRRVVGTFAVTALILTIPLVAMQFTDEVTWTLTDFVVAGAMLLSAGLAYEFVAGRTHATLYRAAAGLAVGTMLFLVWAILAVGVIGAEGDPFDLIYGAVIAIAVMGALAARFDPRGMARALLAAATAQALVIVVALLLGKQHSEVSSIGEIVMINGIFVALFATAAALFWQAARSAGEINAS